MIDEKYLRSAVNIRRTYLKVSNNLNLYHNRAKEMVETLNKTLSDIEELSKKIEEGKKTGKVKVTEDDAVKALLKILQDIDDEGAKMEKLTEPINKEIEKLALEEQELYKQIKQAHPNLSDDDIINSVKDRLQKEGLS